MALIETEKPTRESGNPSRPAMGGCQVGETDYQQAMSAGFQAHLPKPVEPHQLIEAILNLCS